VDESSDDLLVTRSRRGDPRALAELYRRHAPTLLAYLERILRERAEAEDVLQETYLRIFQGRGRYTGPGTIPVMALHRRHPDRFRSSACAAAP